MASEFQVVITGIQDAELAEKLRERALTEAGHLGLSRLRGYVRHLATAEDAAASIAEAFDRAAKQKCSWNDCPGKPCGDPVCELNDQEEPCP